MSLLLVNGPYAWADVRVGKPAKAPAMPRLTLAILTIPLLAVTVQCAESIRLTFEQDVRPILKEHCFDCHGAHRDLEANLDLRLVRRMIAGGDSGPAIQPGDAKSSLLVERLKSGEMPPGGSKVPPQQISIIEAWLTGGAATLRNEPTHLEPGIGITPEERAFWAFQPIRRPVVPAPEGGHRIRTPIDAFLLSRLRDHGLSFASDADRRTLITRLSLDLRGLPPTFTEIDEFVRDDSPTAYASLVGRFLDSPSYGERWARHWLDVAGYADSEGYSDKDADRPWAYLFRNYVIKSFNDDKPINEFIVEQLAGDELVSLPYKNLSTRDIERLTATGLLRMAADGTGSGSNNEAARNQTIADTIKIVSRSLLGLSVECAQCHDHRYDPIPQRDYYSLRAVFAPAMNWKQWRTPQQRLISLYRDSDRKQADEIEAKAQRIVKERATKQSEFMELALEKELKRHPEDLRGKLRDAYKTVADQRTGEQKKLLAQFPSLNITPGNLYQYNQKHADKLKEYDAKVASVRATKPVQRFLRALTEVPSQVPETKLFHRGEYSQPTESVPAAALTISSAPGERKFIGDDPQLKTSGRRLAYARWLTSGQHPLVTRVLVNRIWMHHFGRGIVGTASDFGVLGERPTHPELLDWLATELVRGNWSLKHLHRVIVMSTAYRQGAVADPQALQIDSANQLYWKWPLRRLEAETVRDRILAASGGLNSEMHCPPIGLKVDDAGQVSVDHKDAHRSIYIRVKRTQPVSMLKAFDAPVMEVNCQQRRTSTAASQALMMMNSEFILHHAQQFAQRVAREIESRDQSDNPISKQIRRAWMLAYGRQPSETELTSSLRFMDDQITYLKEQASDSKTSPNFRALTNFCQVLLSSNEFLYLQ